MVLESGGFYLAQTGICFYCTHISTNYPSLDINLHLPLPSVVTVVSGGFSHVNMSEYVLQGLFPRHHVM